MSLLRDFVGAFATNIGNDMQQRENEQRAIALQEEIENRRIRRQEEAEIRRRRMSNEDRSTELNMQGPQIGVDDDGRQSLLRVRSSVDPESGALLAERERVGDAPVTPVGRPMTIYDGANRRSVQRYSDGSERDLGAPSPVRAAQGGSSRTAVGEDGLTAYQREQLKRTDAREERLAKQSGRGGGKPESADAIRAKWTEIATAVNGAEGEALRSIAVQYGMDQRGLPTDDDSLKAAILANVEAEFGDRLKSAKGKPAPQTDDKAAPSSARVLAEARKAIAQGRDPELVKRKAARLLGIDPEDVDI